MSCSSMVPPIAVSAPARGPSLSPRRDCDVVRARDTAPGLVCAAAPPGLPAPARVLRRLAWRPGRHAPETAATTSGPRRYRLLMIRRLQMDSKALVQDSHGRVPSAWRATA